MTFLDMGEHVDTRRGNVEHKITNIYAPPLHFAVKNGHIEVVRLLLERKANVDSKSVNSRTPLAIALSQKERTRSMIELLLLNGARVSDSNYWGTTIMEQAESTGDKDIIGLVSVYYDAEMLKKQSERCKCNCLCFF